MASADTARLGTFQKHIENMRNLSLCKICIKPFYEPFILACGHTYCYSCLTSWFTGPHNHEKVQKCPDCRAEVQAQPSPNYILRDMVHMFISRAELLPEDETVEEHQRAKVEEARLLSADRTGPGLFKNIFARRGRRHLPGFSQMAHILGRQMPMPIRDHEDGVMRCPTCAWELEEGECIHCGYFEGMAYNSDDSEAGSHSASDAEDGDSIDFEHQYGGDYDIGRHMAEAMGNLHGIPEIDLTEDSDSEDSIRGGLRRRYEDDEEEDEMNSFIDDDDLPDELDEEDHDDDESEHTITGNLEYGEYPAPPFSSDVDSDGDGYESGHVPDRPQQRFYGITNHSPSSSSASDDDTAAQEDSADDTNSEQATNYDESDDDSVQEIPAPIIRTGRQRRIIDSDDEEEDVDEDENEDEAEDSDEEEDEDDEPIRPPQNSAIRRQRLILQRARRAHSQESHQRHIYGQPNYERAQAPSNFETSRRSRPHIMRVY